MRPGILRYVIASAIALASVGSAQTITAPPDATGKVDRIFSEFKRNGPGCAVGATIDGATVLSAGYGMADLEHNVPITPTSVFEQVLSLSNSRRAPCFC